MHVTGQLARVTIAAGMALLAACGGDSSTSLTANTSATIRNVIIADNPSSATSTGSGGSGTSTYNGTLTGTVQAQISTDGQAWVSLGSPQPVSIALQSTTNATQVGVAATVPAGTYAYVRLVFSNGAQATANGTVAGSSYSGQVVSLGSGQVIIQKQIQPVTLQAGASYNVAWDLNSESWLTTTALQSQTAASAAVQAAAYATITGA